MEDEEEKEEEEAEQEEQEEQETDEAPAVPEEFMFDVEGVALDPDVMKFATKAKSGRSGSRGMIFSEERGRYIKPILPKGRVRKLAVDATMRTAAPYQAKRPRARAEEKDGRSLRIRGARLHRGRRRAREEDGAQGGLARRFRRRCVGVDGAQPNERGERSGDQPARRGVPVARQDLPHLVSGRLRAGCVAADAFDSDGEEPPRADAVWRRIVLAHALNQAAQVGMTSQKTGDVGEVLVVCISDGRANVPLAVATDGVTVEEAGVDKAGLKEEVMNTAKMLGSLPNFKLLMLDTENKFVSTGLAKEIAQAAQGKYHYIPKGGANAVTNVASAAIADLRG